MSFLHAMHEIEDLELKCNELERLSRGKDNEIARLKGKVATEPKGPTIVQALNGDSGVDAAKTIADFIEHHLALETGMNVFATRSQSDAQAIVRGIVSRLRRDQDDQAVVVETLRLAQGLLRESRGDCEMLVENAFELFVTRVSRKVKAPIRDAALRCFQLCIMQNAELRFELIESEQSIDILTLAIEEWGALIKDPDESANGECARIIVVTKNLFEGTQSEDDALIARLLLKSGFVSAAVHRMSRAYLEVADLKMKSLKESDFPVLSTTCEGISRGSLLIDGFRFLYAVAIFADNDMLEFMKANDNKPTLAGGELERCDLSDPNLGVGDRYVFLQTHVLLATAGEQAIKRDVDNFDAIKISVCSILMFADKAPGFIAYLYRRGIARALFDVLDRETWRAKITNNEDNLLSILVAIKTVVENNNDFKDQFQDMFFERLLPEIDPSDYETEEEYKKAAEKRHFAGRSIPDTVFGRVVALLTSFHDHVKRFAGELLYFLCENDPNKVTHFVGFGHAAHILAIKGGMLGQMAGES